MYQFGQYAWTHLILLFVFIPSSFFVSNIFDGIIWFLLPCSLVIANDIFAYLSGDASCHRCTSCAGRVLYLHVCEPSFTNVLPMLRRVCQTGELLLSSVHQHLACSAMACAPSYETFGIACQACTLQRHECTCSLVLPSTCRWCAADLV